MHVNVTTHSPCTLAGLASGDHFSHVAVPCAFRRRKVAARAATSISSQHRLFAATVAPDVVDESASSSEAYNQVSNKATAQQSSEASHVKPCYPEKTINCSDGKKQTRLFSSQFLVRIFSSPFRVNAEEWRARVDLAAIYRVCHNLGLSEGINNHLTAMIPGLQGHFLVFPFGLLWSEVTASNLLLMDNEVRCWSIRCTFVHFSMTLSKY